jgi:hypothetical protein
MHVEGMRRNRSLRDTMDVVVIMMIPVCTVPFIMRPSTLPRGANNGTSTSSTTPSSFSPYHNSCYLGTQVLKIIITSLSTMGTTETGTLPFATRNGYRGYSVETTDAGAYRVAGSGLYRWPPRQSTCIPFRMYFRCCC